MNYNDERCALYNRFNSPHGRVSIRLFIFFFLIRITQTDRVSIVLGARGKIWAKSSPGKSSLRRRSLDKRPLDL